MFELNVSGRFYQQTFQPIIGLDRNVPYINLHNFIAINNIWGMSALFNIFEVMVKISILSAFSSVMNAINDKFEPHETKSFPGENGTFFDFPCINALLYTEHAIMRLENSEYFERANRM